MRKFSILLSILVLAAMVLAACGGEETATNLPSTQVPPTTVEATEAMTEAATEAPTEAATEEATGTPGVPVTGEINPARLSNQLDFTVWSQDGEQIGEVNDMVLDLDNTKVAYVVVGTGGFLDLGDREILVPWDSLQLQTSMGQGTGQATATAGAGAGTGQATATTDAGAGAGQATATSGTGTGTGQATATSGTGTGAGQATATSGAGAGTGDTTGVPQNAFILQGDVEMFRNAPDFDLNNLPQMGQPAGDWDAEIRNFWESGGTGTGTGTGQATQGAGTAEATHGAGTGTGQATATSGTGAGTAQATQGAGTGTGQGTTALQGVVLASEVLGSTVNLSALGTGQATAPAATSGTGTGQATATAGTGAGTGQATATSGTGAGQATATSGTGTGAGQGTAAPGGTGTGEMPTTATIEDMITDINTGDILFIVLNVPFTDTERLLPVPLGMFQFSSDMQGFGFSGDATMLQGAPFFENGQFPDTTTSGWNTEFDTFWQNGGAGGTGTGQMTATPTP